MRTRLSLLSQGALIVTLVASAMAAVAALAACSSSDASTPASDAGNGEAAVVDHDASNDAGTSASDADPDAAPDYDPNVYPAPHHMPPQLVNHGGPVLTAMKLVVITFTGDARRDAIRAYNEGITKDPWWAAASDGYGIAPAASVTFAELDDPFGAGTVDTVATVTPWVQKMVDAGKLPAPDSSTAYAIYFGKDTLLKTPSGSSCTDLVADHESAVLRNGDAGTVEVVMSYLPQCPDVDIFATTSHELIELATDPFPLTRPAWQTNDWAWGSGPLSEVADVCFWWAPLTTALGHPTARAYSNVAARAGHDPCQPAPPGRRYYGAALETQTLSISGYPASDGFIVAHPGTTTEFDGTFFSDGPLPADAKVLVGTPPFVPSWKAFDAMTMAPIGNGITTTLSRQTMHNGQRFKLRVKVPANTPPSSYTVALRAVIAADDFNQWPLVLLVK